MPKTIKLKFRSVVVITWYFHAMKTEWKYPRKLPYLTEAETMSKEVSLEDFSLDQLATYLLFQAIKWETEHPAKAKWHKQIVRVSIDFNIKDAK